VSRDPRKLEVFQMADALVVDVYRSTRALPVEERFGLQAQIRRAAISVPTNIVEGSARRSARDYSHFLNIALGSASETRYLLELSSRLDFLPAKESQTLADRYERLSRALSSLIAHFDAVPKAQGPKPKAQST